MPSLIPSIKLMKLIKNHFLYSWAYYKQTECVVMMTKKKLYLNYKFHDPWVRDFLPGCGHTSHIVDISIYIFHSFHLLLGMNKTNWIYSKKKQEIVNIMTPQGVLKS